MLGVVANCNYLLFVQTSFAENSSRQLETMLMRVNSNTEKLWALKTKTTELKDPEMLVIDEGLAKLGNNFVSARLPSRLNCNLVSAFLKKRNRSIIFNADVIRPCFFNVCDAHFTCPALRGEWDKFQSNKSVHFWYVCMLLPQCPWNKQKLSHRRDNQMRVKRKISTFIDGGIQLI